MSDEAMEKILKMHSNASRNIIPPSLHIANKLIEKVDPAQFEWSVCPDCQRHCWPPLPEGIPRPTVVSKVFTIPPGPHFYCPSCAPDMCEAQQAPVTLDLSVPHVPMPGSRFYAIANVNGTGHTVRPRMVGFDLLHGRHCLVACSPLNAFLLFLPAVPLLPGCEGCLPGSSNGRCRPGGSIGQRPGRPRAWKCRTWHILGQS